LSGEEVASLDLRRTELVVLSACETGIGKVAGSEGVFGLQRAFAMAGSRSVVGSLWKVDDSATQILMTEFYRNLWEKKLNKLEALRQAQLAMLKRYSPGERRLRGAEMVDEGQPPAGNSPYYWAAFVLSGDWR
jgi:CHAT domain-containing protein